MGVRSKERDAARDFVVRALAGGDMTLVLLPDGRLQPKVSSEATVALALPVTEPVVDPDPDEALVAANRTRIAELRAAPVGGNVIGFSDVLADREAKVGLVAISLAALHLVLVAIAQWRVSHGGAPIPLLLPALACPCLLVHLLAGPLIALGAAVAGWPASLVAVYGRLRRRHGSRVAVAVVRSAGLGLALVAGAALATGLV